MNEQTKAINNLAESISIGCKAIATSLDKLGNGNANTEMGAIENLAKRIEQGMGICASTLDSISKSLDESITYLADVMRSSKELPPPKK
jgi:hypothetical protein